MGNYFLDTQYNMVKLYIGANKLGQTDKQTL